MKRFIKIFLVLLFLLVLVIFKTNKKETAPTITKNDAPELVQVTVIGAVNSPGLKTVSVLTTLKELFYYAKPLLYQADLSGYDLNDFVVEGGVYLIPFKSAENEIKEEEETSKINLNLATKEELMTLLEIGEKKAIEIINYRNLIGYFKEIEEIMEVTGIKAGVYEKIKDFITV